MTRFGDTDHPLELRLRSEPAPDRALSDREVRMIVADATDLKNGGCRYVLLREHRGQIIVERLQDG